MTYTVRFAPEAQAQIDALEDFIAVARSAAIAASYIDALIAYCESLETFPHRGIQRDDLLPGIRITNYRRNTVIAFQVDTDAKTVSILGVFHGGQNYAAAWQDESEL